MAQDIEGRVDEAVRAMPARFVPGGDPVTLLCGILVSRSDLLGQAALMPSARRLRAALGVVSDCVAQPRFDPTDGRTRYEHGPAAMTALAGAMRQGDRAILHFDEGRLAEAARSGGAPMLEAIGTIAKEAQERGPGRAGSRIDPYQDDLYLFEAGAPTRRELATKALGKLERRSFSGRTLVAVPVCSHEVADAVDGSERPAPVARAIAALGAATRQPTYDADGTLTGELMHGREGLAMLGRTFGKATMRRLWLDPDALADEAARSGHEACAQVSMLAETGAARRRAMEMPERHQPTPAARVADVGRD